MKNNGFTLVELLAVVVIISIITLMGTVGIQAAKRGINGYMWETTEELIESAAQTFGNDKKEYIKNLDNACEIDGESKVHCITITVQTLIDRGYLTTRDTITYNDIEKYKVITNKTVDKSNNEEENFKNGYYVNNYNIFIYVENDVVYTKYSETFLPSTIIVNKEPSKEDDTSGGGSGSTDEAKKITMADICRNGQFLSSCIKSMNGKDDTLYYHDGSLTNGINDGSYRYAGASADVNNYVCISDEETCSDANLFRIIGVFDEGVKLIKATSIGDYAWASDGLNTWSSASLNTYLNGDYLTSLGDFATNYIATTTWKVGGNTDVKIYFNVTPTTAYTNEITSPANSNIVSKKIGLMYVSDYYYAASQTYWSKVGYSSSGSSYDYRAATGSNWLYLGSFEWLITPVSDTSYGALGVISAGCVNLFAGNGVADSYAVRPVFYLGSKVAYAGGEGTLESPMRLS